MRGEGRGGGSLHPAKSLSHSGFLQLVLISGACTCSSSCGATFIPDKLLSDECPPCLLFWDSAMLGCWLLAPTGLRVSVLNIWSYYCLIWCLLERPRKHYQHTVPMLSPELCIVDIADSLSVCLPSLYQPPPRSVLCSGLWSARSRSAHAGSKPLDRLPGRPQHLSLHLLLHTAQETQHHQHVGGCRCGGDTSCDGLDCGHRLSGARYECSIVLFWASYIFTLLKWHPYYHF